jgi:large subunit ribosomal protein L18
MRAVKSPRGRHELRARRHLRVRKKVAGTAERPRLAVFRSLKHIYVQLVDDNRGVCLLGMSDGSEGVTVDGAGKVGKAKGLGKAVAAKCKAAGFSKVVFDRAGYRYHGRVKAVADGAREGGLEF